MEEQKYIKENIRLDCENQHYKHYQEGYREAMLITIHGLSKVSDELQIDVDRYSPDGIKRLSYDQGWDDAMNDLML